MFPWQIPVCFVAKKIKNKKKINYNNLTNNVKDLELKLSKRSKTVKNI